jgi:hypothetical protein
MVLPEFRDGGLEHVIRHPSLDDQHAARGRVSDRQEWVNLAGAKERQGGETQSQQRPTAQSGHHALPSAQQTQTGLV